MGRPPGDRLRQAVVRLSEERAARPGEPVARTVDRVALALDLDAAESEWLLRQALEASRAGRGPESPQ